MIKQSNYVPKENKPHIKLIQSAFGWFLYPSAHPRFEVAIAYCSKVTPGYYATAGAAARQLYSTTPQEIK